MTSRAASRRQAPGETRARELSDGRRKDGGGSIEGGRWPGHEERPDFELEKRSSAVGSGGCGTIQRGPFLMARSSLSRAWAAASRTGVLRGSRTQWVEGKGGEGRGAGQGTVTRSQRARPRNGRLQGWTTGAQRACVCSHERAVWVRARRSRHSRSAWPWTSCPRPHGLETALDRRTRRPREQPPLKGDDRAQRGWEIESDTRCIAPKGWCHGGVYSDSIWRWRWHGNVTTAGRPASPGGHQTIGTWTY